MSTSHLPPEPGNPLPAAMHQEQPTTVRYRVLTFCVAMSVILYLDRYAISVPLKEMANDLHLEVKAVGDAMALFFLFYALFQVPAGLLGDRWGGRRALALYMVAWSLAMGGIGLATGLTSLMVMRGLLGVGQAGAYATTASFLRRWIPTSQRGFANSAVSLGGRGGAMLVPSLTPVLMAGAALWLSGVDRWRPVFGLYALVGLLWAVWFWRWFRDDPRQHPATNEAEVALIEGSQPAGESAALASGAIPWRALVTNRGLLLLALVGFFVNVGWIFVATWLPTYLIEVHGASDKEAGLLTSLTAFAGMVGCLAGGIATDWLVKRTNLAQARRLPGMIAYGGASMGLLGCWLIDEKWTIITLLVVSSFLSDFALGALWAAFQDIGGQYAGTALGFSNMCGNLGAACATSVIGRLVEGYGWSSAFALGASAYAIAAIGWIGVDSRRGIAGNRRTAPAGPSQSD